MDHADAHGNQLDAEDQGHGKTVAAMAGADQLTVWSDVHSDAAELAVIAGVQLRHRPDAVFPLDHTENAVQPGAALQNVVTGETASDPRILRDGRFHPC